MSGSTRVALRKGWSESSRTSNTCSRSTPEFVHGPTRRDEELHDTWPKRRTHPHTKGQAWDHEDYNEDGVTLSCNLQHQKSASPDVADFRSHDTLERPDEGLWRHWGWRQVGLLRESVFGARRVRKFPFYTDDISKSGGLRRALYREIRWKRTAKRKRRDTRKARPPERQRGGTVLTLTPILGRSVGALPAGVMIGFISTFLQREAAMQGVRRITLLSQTFDAGAAPALSGETRSLDLLSHGDASRDRDERGRRSLLAWGQLRNINLPRVALAVSRVFHEVAVRRRRRSVAHRPGPAQQPLRPPTLSRRA